MPPSNVRTPSHPEKILEKLKAQDNHRSLVDVETLGADILVEGRRYKNFSSNDYLGLSGNLPLQQAFFSQLEPHRAFLLSNPSSRLLTGNSVHYRRLESTLSGLFGGRAALVLGSGYLANAGILPALVGKKDFILADKRVHASLIDGLKLCEAPWQRFAHNDMSHLKALLSEASGYENLWVVTESLFSMDGDFAPLQELWALRKRYGFKLYVDEAHAFGVYGGGLGKAHEEGVEPDVMVATLGKALASCGAFVLCDEATRELLINRMRTLLFSTALPPINLLWSDFVLQRLAEFEAERQKLFELVELMGGLSPIVPLMAGENARALEMAQALREGGFWANAIRSPTVPRGKARVRVSLSAGLEREDILKFKETWNCIG